MLPRERIQAAFEHRPTDRVPVHHIGLSSRVASAVLGREAFVGGGIQQWREAAALWQGEAAHQEFLERSFRDALDLALALDQEIVRPEYWRMARRPARRLDEYTFVYGSEGNERVMRFDPVTELYQEVDSSPQAEPSLEELGRQAAAAEKSAESYRPAESAFAAALRAQALIGAERVVRVGGVGLEIPREPIWLEAVAVRPDRVARHLDTQAERAVRNVAFLAERGFRYFWGGGDLASNRGPFYSPRAFHDLMLPRLRRISDACHRYGGYHLFASDGNLWPVADDLFGASGVDGFYEIDRRAGMELGLLRERFPRLTLLGNISSHTLHQGTPEDVAAETLSCLEDARRHGNIIVGCSNQVVSETPRRNFQAMVKLMERYR
jgi:uroporphyrinogen decarboxylase-like protein